MSYLIAVLPSRVKAEEAYVALEKAGLPTEQLAIVGQGYQSADEFGLIDPNEPAKRQIRLMALWLVPFGFVAGATFNALTEITIWAQAGALGNRALGGVLGAIAGAMGAFVAGGGAGLLIGGGDALPYRNRLNEGKYLVVVRGSQAASEQARRVLQPLEPENLQGYTEPAS
jgi:hypothetical protein